MESIASFGSHYLGKNRLPQRFLISILIGPIILKPMKWDNVGSLTKCGCTSHIFNGMHSPKMSQMEPEKKIFRNEKNGEERDMRMHFNL